MGATYRRMTQFLDPHDLLVLSNSFQLAHGHGLYPQYRKTSLKPEVKIDHAVERSRFKTRSLLKKIVMTTKVKSKLVNGPALYI